jgi:hypothetical protein
MSQSHESTYLMQWRDCRIGQTPAVYNMEENLSLLPPPPHPPPAPVLFWCIPPGVIIFTKKSFCTMILLTTFCTCTASVLTTHTEQYADVLYQTRNPPRYPFHGIYSIKTCRLIFSLFIKAACPENEFMNVKFR